MLTERDQTRIDLRKVIDIIDGRTYELWSSPSGRLIHTLWTCACLKLTKAFTSSVILII